MRVYTEKDLESFEIDDFGYLICPTGDYSQIKKFGDWCIFSKGCDFSGFCKFGDNCKFDKYCKFGEYSSFGKNCVFDNGCEFDNYCIFNTGCIFGDFCKFSDKCKFGDYCKFGEDCEFENLEEPAHKVLKIDRIGSRKGCTYFFKTTSDIYVRCGCFFGTVAEFENAGNTTHKNNEQYRNEYL